MGNISSTDEDKTINWDHIATPEFHRDFERLYELLAETNFKLCCCQEDGTFTEAELALARQFDICSVYDEELFEDGADDGDDGDGDDGDGEIGRYGAFVQHIQAIMDFVEQHIDILNKQIRLHEEMESKFDNTLSIRKSNIETLGKVTEKVASCEQSANKGRQDSAITGIAAGVSFFIFPFATPFLAVGSAVGSVSHTLIEAEVKGTLFKEANELFSKDISAMDSLQKHGEIFLSETERNYENLREVHRLISMKHSLYGTSSGSTGVAVPLTLGLVGIAALGLITYQTARVIGYEAAKNIGKSTGKALSKSTGKNLSKSIGKSSVKAVGKVVGAVAAAVFVVTDIIELVDCINASGKISDALRQLYEQKDLLNKNRRELECQVKKHQKVRVRLQDEREKLQEFVDVAYQVIQSGVVRSVCSLKEYLEAMCRFKKLLVRTDTTETDSGSESSSSDEDDEETFNVSTLNLHSLNASDREKCRSKCEYVKSLILRNEIDVLFLSETWLSKRNEDVILEKCLPNADFTYISDAFPSSHPKRGVAIIYNSSKLESTNHCMYSYDSVDGCGLNFISKENEKISFQGTSIYCPPDRPKFLRLKALTEVYLTHFMREVSFSLISDTIKSLLGKKKKFRYQPQEIIIAGDYNIPLNDVNNRIVKAYVEMNRSFGMKIQPTVVQAGRGTQKVGNNILDHINTRVRHLRGVSVDEEPAQLGFSDHYLVSAEITVQSR